jgi:mRNA-degrading endonuclease YafQ of YafQ-DinJ toxin-antitoxin module
LNLRLRYHTDFKSDYLKIKEAVKDPKGFDRELKELVTILLARKAPEPKYITNLLVTDGEGWRECFVYSDKKQVIVVQYKLEKDFVYLARIGRPEVLSRKKKIFLQK